MAQDYDKIFKENIEEIILPLAEKLLNIKVEKLEKITQDLQHTIERKPDFLKKVVHKDSSKDYILHIEFQVADEPEMAYRMLEYYAMLLRSHDLDLKQAVFFIGNKKPQMITRFEKENLSFAYNLIDMQQVDYKQFVNSNKPEEVILAILADFGKEDTNKVIQTIIKQIKAITKPNLKQKKYVKQLEILSKLRGLQSEIINQIEIMALTYDLENDIRYQQGEKIGEEKKSITAIKNLIRLNLSHQQIADSLEVSLEFVEKVVKELSKK
ncbi:MAG: hypothetical protein COZ18_15515 [Flexibacter sp. CG_4_10_14_3_um_filter_32_15]|nr:MAG: hypothetical protein COZ18_15515 [Flexibacter sp. CG_4_10_14_3_um_filter_32_15]